MQMWQYDRHEHNQILAPAAVRFRYRWDRAEGKRGSRFFVKATYKPSNNGSTWHTENNHICRPQRVVDSVGTALTDICSNTNTNIQHSIRIFNKILIQIRSDPNVRPSKKMEITRKRICHFFIVSVKNATGTENTRSDVKNPTKH